MRDIEQYSQRYQNDLFEDKLVAFRHRKVTEIMQQYPHRNILEVGCGEKPIYHFVQDFDSLTIVEPSSLFCGEIQQRDRSVLEKAPIEIIQDFLEHCWSQLQGKKFDFILVSSLLHEVENPAQLLDCVAELSAKDTVIHINVPNRKSFHNILAYDAGLIQDITELSSRSKAFDRHSTFDMDSLKDFVQQHGFDVLDSGYYVIKPFTSDQMQQMLDCGILNSQVLDGLYAMSRRIPELSAEMYINVRKFILNKKL